MGKMGVLKLIILYVSVLSLVFGLGLFSLNESFAEEQEHDKEKEHEEDNDEKEHEEDNDEKEYEEDKKRIRTRNRI